MSSTISDRSRNLVTKLLSYYDELSMHISTHDIHEGEPVNTFARRRIAQNLLRKLRSQILSKYEFSTILIALPISCRSTDEHVSNDHSYNVVCGLMKALKILMVLHRWYDKHRSLKIDEYYKEVIIIRELLAYAFTGIEISPFINNSQLMMQQRKILLEYKIITEDIPSVLRKVLRIPLHKNSPHCDSIEFNFPVKSIEDCHSNLNQLNLDINTADSLVLHSCLSKESSSHEHLIYYRHWLLYDGLSLPPLIYMGGSATTLDEVDAKRLLKMEDNFHRLTKLIASGCQSDTRHVLHEALDDLKMFKDFMLIDFPVNIWLHSTHNYQQTLSRARIHPWQLFNYIETNECIRLGGGLGVLSAIIRLVGIISSSHLLFATKSSRPTNNNDGTVGINLLYLATQALLSIDFFLNVLGKTAKEWMQQMSDDNEEVRSSYESDNDTLKQNHCSRFETDKYDYVNKSYSASSAKNLESNTLSVGGTALICYETAALFLAIPQMQHIAVKIMIRSFEIVTYTTSIPKMSSNTIYSFNCSSILAARVSTALLALESSIERWATKCIINNSHIQNCCDKDINFVALESVTLAILLVLHHLDSIPDNMHVQFHNSCSTCRHFETREMTTAIMVPSSVLSAIKCVTSIDEHGNFSRDMSDRFTRIKQRMKLGSIECCDCNKRNWLAHIPTKLLDPSIRCEMLHHFFHICQGTEDMAQLFVVLDTELSLIVGLGERLVANGFYEILHTIISHRPSTLKELMIYKGALDILTKLIPFVSQAVLKSSLNTLIHVGNLTFFSFLPSNEFDQKIIAGSQSSMMKIDNLDDLVLITASLICDVRHRFCDILLIMISLSNKNDYNDVKLLIQDGLIVNDVLVRILRESQSSHNITSRLRAYSIMVLGKLFVQSELRALPKMCLSKMEQVFRQIIKVQSTDRPLVLLKGAEQELITLAVCFQSIGVFSSQNFHSDIGCTWLKWCIQHPESKIRLNGWIMICSLLEISIKDKLSSNTDCFDYFLYDAFQSLGRQRESKQVMGNSLKYLALRLRFSKDSKHSDLLSKISDILGKLPCCQLGVELSRRMQLLIHSKFAGNEQMWKDSDQNCVNVLFCQEFYTTVNQVLMNLIMRYTESPEFMKGERQISLLPMGQAFTYLRLYNLAYQNETLNCMLEFLKHMLSFTSRAENFIGSPDTLAYFISSIFQFLSCILSPSDCRISTVMCNISVNLFGCIRLWQQNRSTRSDEIYFAFSSGLDLTMKLLRECDKTNLDLRRIYVELAFIYETVFATDSPSFSNDDSTSVRVRQKLFIVLSHVIEKALHVPVNNSTEEWDNFTSTFVSRVVNELKIYTVAYKNYTKEKNQASIVAECNIRLTMLKSVLFLEPSNRIIREEFSLFFNQDWIRFRNEEITAAYFPCSIKSLLLCALEFICNFVISHEQNKMVICDKENSMILSRILSIMLEQNSSNMAESLHRYCKSVAHRILYSLVSPKSPSKCRMAIISMFPSMKSFLQLNLAKLSSRSKNLRDQVRGMLQVFVVATIDKHGRNLVYKRQADTIFDVIEHALGLSKKGVEVPLDVQSIYLDIIRNVVFDQMFKRKFLSIDNSICYLVMSLRSESDLVRKSAARSIWCLSFKSIDAISQLKSEYDMSSELSIAFELCRDVNTREALTCTNQILTKSSSTVDQKCIETFN